jgi:catechol 2,3-dioxygenase-like lactoylglutathione lyase family enzyme
MLEILPDPRGAAGPSDPENPKFHIAVSVANLEETVAALGEEGVVFSEKIKEASGGVRLSVIRDPEGNDVQLIYRPHPFQ